MSMEVNCEPDEFNCDILHSFIQNFALSRNYENFTYQVDCISGAGINFIANIFRVHVRDCDNDDNVKEESVILKSLVNTLRQELFGDIHKREVLAYTDVIAKFNEAQIKLNKEDVLTFPECYMHSFEHNQEVLVLEDLHEKGYFESKAVKNRTVDVEEAELVVKELAKLHALSFVIRNKNSEITEEWSKKYKDIIYDEEFLNKTKLKDYFNDSFKESLSLVKDEDAKVKLSKLEAKLIEILRNLVKAEENSVICHGDCWINNVFMKYNNEDKPTSACFVDFQTMRCSDPTTDILHFLYLGTDSKFRNIHLTKLLEIYYHTFEEYLRKFHMESETVYPKETFLRDFKKKSTYGLLIALVHMKTVTMTAAHDAISHGSKLTGHDNIDEVPGERVWFDYRVNDVVDEFVNNGLLDEILMEYFS